jgi:hypothetical protein
MEGFIMDNSKKARKLRFAQTQGIADIPSTWGNIEKKCVNVKTRRKYNPQTKVTRENNRLLSEYVPTRTIRKKAYQKTVFDNAMQRQR